MSEQSPITLTTSPRLSLALQGDGPGFERAMDAVGQNETASWIRKRVDDAVEPAMLTEAVEAWFSAATVEDRVMARVDLAELLADADEPSSELLWEASMHDGFSRDDGEQAFDAVVHLAQLAEATGDPLTAAEFYIDFLNWRRGEGHVSDPESVHQAFEEIIRLAEVGGDPAAAARFTHAHAQFARLGDDDPEAASEGDWAESTAPFAGWE